MPWRGGDLARRGAGLREQLSRRGAHHCRAPCCARRARVSSAVYRPGDPKISTMRQSPITGPNFQPTWPGMPLPPPRAASDSCARAIEARLRPWCATAAIATGLRRRARRTARPSRPTATASCSTWKARTRAHRHPQPEGAVQQGAWLLHRSHHARAWKVPTTYRRRQTLKNAERFITPELKAFEDKALSADRNAPWRARNGCSNSPAGPACRPTSRLLEP